MNATTTITWNVNGSARASDCGRFTITRTGRHNGRGYMLWDAKGTGHGCDCLSEARSLAERIKAISAELTAIAAAMEPRTKVVSDGTYSRAVTDAQWPVIRYADARSERASGITDMHASRIAPFGGWAACDADCDDVGNMADDGWLTCERNVGIGYGWDTHNLRAMGESAVNADDWRTFDEYHAVICR